MSPSKTARAGSKRAVRKPTAKVDLTVNAAPGTEIFVIDHVFRLKGRGVGTLSVSLAPGLYKLKFRAGSAIVEVHQEITGDRPAMTVEAPSVAISSAAPIAAARTTHGYQEDAAREVSRAVHRRAGRGSKIMIFARAWTETRGEQRVPPVPSDHDPASGLSLVALDGSLISDLGRDGVRAGTPDPWVGCTIALDPGPYRLRLATTRWGVLEQVVVAVRGWQTQIFLLQANFGTEDDPEFRPDLNEATSMLAPLRSRFDPSSDDLRLVEVARQSLAHGREVLSVEELSAAVSPKRRPMIAVYGAHALLARGQTTSLGPVVASLSEVLPDHPDVASLRLALGQAPGDPFAVPPMLSSSWSIVVEKAARQPELVPAESLAARIGPYLWGNGPNLIWLADRVDESVPASASPIEEVLAPLTEQVQQSTVSPILDEDLDDVESALLDVLRHPATSAPPAEAGTKKAAKSAAPSRRAASKRAPVARSATGETALDPAELSSRLGLAPASLQVAAEGLSKKLKDRE